MFEFNSKSKADVLRAATVVVSLMSFHQSGACAADITDSNAASIELKPLSPQVDSAPPVDVAPTANEPVAPKLHKLEASKRALRDDPEEQTPTVQIEESPQTIKHIVINSYVMRANLPNTVISDPFTLMRALLGSRSKEYEKLYAERDTGYGV